MWQFNATRHRKTSLEAKSETGAVKVAIKLFKKSRHKSRRQHKKGRPLHLFKCNQIKFGRYIQQTWISEGLQAAANGTVLLQEILHWGEIKERPVELSSS